MQSPELRRTPLQDIHNLGTILRDIAPDNRYYELLDRVVHPASPK